jgi:arylsulfatase
MACITEGTTGFPGGSGRIPFENGTIAEVLNERGWNTYAVGKWHLTPAEEENASSWKHRWPLRRGFERFYGFMGGETNQWYPDLIYDNHPVEQPYVPENGYHLSKDLADKAIEFIRDAKVVAPDKPFFMYFCPGCAHAPHHVFKEWADKYKGKFDMGYEAIRETILANQKKMGILPEDTNLSPINPHGEPHISSPDGKPWPMLDWVRPWDTLSDDEKRLFARMAEVYAGFVSYTDYHIGRLLDYLEESGQLDNTIIVVVSDNGASGEGGPNGSVNEVKFFNNIPDTMEENMKHLEDLGSPATYNHYCNGWAWAFDTPFPYWKRFAGYEGGTADMCLVAWPQQIPVRSEKRYQYIHAVDLVPTVYDLLGIESPAVLNGYTQSPLEGESFKGTVNDPHAAEKETQFYSMLGQRGIYHQGWLANTVHPPLSGWGNFADDVWELYNLQEDRAQVNNVAVQYSDKLESLKELWNELARVYNALPLDDRTPIEIVTTPRPQPAKPRNRYVYYPDTADVSEAVSVNIRGRSYTIVAGVVVDTAEAEGVLFAQGHLMGGHALYIKDKKLHYLYNWLGEDMQETTSSVEISTGRHIFTAEFAKTGQDPQTKSALGTLTLYVDTEQVGQSEIKTQPGYFSLVGEGLCVGRDSGSPVSPDYAPPFTFTGGSIDRVIVDVAGEPFTDYEKEARAWIMKD